MLLQMMTWAEAEAAFKRSPAAIVPIGSTEQHGPNGLIGTDAQTADYVARGVGDVCDAVVTPCIAVAQAQHHMAFAGSMCLKPSTLILVIKEYVESLARHGVERVYFLNGHGGNITTLNVAFCEIYNEQTFGREPKVICRQRNWFDGKAIRDKIKELYGDKDGSHATISEVSMTQYLFPDHIKTVGEEMGPPSNWRGGFRDAEDYRSKFPDGRIGAHSWLATPSDGEAFYKLAVDEVAADYRKFLAGEFG